MNTDYVFNMDWRVEYEVFPLRAIYFAYFDGTYTEDEVKTIFHRDYPHRKIRNIGKFVI